MARILLAMLIAVAGVLQPGNVSRSIVSAQPLGSAVGVEELTAAASAPITRVGTGKVAILGAPSTSTGNTDVQNKILSTGIFAQVDIFNVAFPNPTPSVAQLQQYCAVLVYSDTFFGDHLGLGDVLADYMDAGGGVVLATFAFWFPFGGPGIGGRIVEDGYLPFTQGTQKHGAPLTLIKDQPAHPIFNGVNSLNGGLSSFHNSPIAITLGATLLGHWSNGQPLVAIKKPTAGTIVGLNFYPPSSDVRRDLWVSSTDGARLTANSLNFACSATAIFDVCLQDDSNPSIVFLGNAQTGAYKFCCGGTVFTGVAQVIRRGSTFTFQDNSPDRRVLAIDDESVHKGKASLQSPPGSIKCTIGDRNTTNNSCACQ